MSTDSDWIIGMFVAKIIGIKYEDSAEGCDALVKAIKVRGR